MQTQVDLALFQDLQRAQRLLADAFLWIVLGSVITRIAWAAVRDYLIARAGIRRIL